MHRTVARAPCALQNVKKLACSEHFWKMRSAKTRLCKKVVQITLSEWCGIVPTISAARTLVDMVRRSCCEGLQPAVAKRIGTAARSKASVMLRPSCYATAGSCYTHCDSCAKCSSRTSCYSCIKRDCSWRLLNALKQLHEELGCRSYRRACWEAA